MILIGGYTLRGFIPYSRATRDCDFVMQEQDGWNVDRIRRWRAEGFSVDTLEKRETYAFMKWVRLLSLGRRSGKVSVDFMEGDVRGRATNQVVLVDDDFIRQSMKVKIAIAGREFDFFVPTYTDYLILKIVSSRPSDVRDIAALVWRNGVPKELIRTNESNTGIWSGAVRFLFEMPRDKLPIAGLFIAGVVLGVLTAVGLL